MRDQEVDATEALLRRYFREAVAAEASRPPAGAGSRAGRVLARLAVAAAVALTLILPLTPAGRASPSARSFALLHERLETDRVLREGLIQAKRFVHSYMSSAVTAEKGDRND